MMSTSLGTDLHNPRMDLWDVITSMVRDWLSPLDATFVFEALGGEFTSVIIELVTYKDVPAHNIAAIIDDPGFEAY
eukprot:2597991-Heterocapsa_arctica.AAC.1